MYKFIIICFVLFFPFQVSFASCHTGFACNIQQLENQEKQKQNEFVNLINKYFEKRYIEKNYVTDKFNILSYNDIFMFNTIL